LKGVSMKFTTMGQLGWLGGSLLLVMACDEEKVYELSDVTVTPLAQRTDDAASCSQGQFSSMVDFPTGGDSWSVSTADLNGDGATDLAVLNSDMKTVSVLIGNGDGTFALNVDYPTGNYPTALAIGDYDGNGLPDLAVANYHSNTISVLSGNGDGTFASKTDYPTGSNPADVVTADFDGDGLPDLAVTNIDTDALTDTDSVSVLLGNGDGTFAAKVDYPTADHPEGIAIGDFNGDGSPDLLVGTASTDPAAVLFGNGDGTFESGKDLTEACKFVRFIVGDWDADGKADLAMPGCSDGTIRVLLGQGDGTFTLREESKSGGLAGALASGDLNGDGLLDLVVTNDNEDESDTVGILFGEGDGTLTLMGQYTTGNSMVSVAIADLNRDTWNDLAITSFGSKAVSVVLNGCR
jgi:hypothetical protein